MFVEVRVLCGSEQEADVISRIAVEGRLAAYAHTYMVKSHYRWEGKLVTCEETVLELGTVSERVDAIRMMVKENHSYEVPSFTVSELHNVEHDYATWLRNNSTEPIVHWKYQPKYNLRDDEY